MATYGMCRHIRSYSYHTRHLPPPTARAAQHPGRYDVHSAFLLRLDADADAVEVGEGHCATARLRARRADSLIGILGLASSRLVWGGAEKSPGGEGRPHFPRLQRSAFFRSLSLSYSYSYTRTHVPIGCLTGTGTDTGEPVPGSPDPVVGNARWRPLGSPSENKTRIK
jgi:hypothetical protein